MSNIWTAFLRIYAAPGRRIDHGEAESLAATFSANDGDEWRNHDGSYWVPVHFRVAEDGRYADIQYGDGKGLGLEHFLQDCYDGSRYSALWGRHYDDGSDEDLIYRRDIDDERRFCRYGFDEVRVTTTNGDRPPAGPPGHWRQIGDSTWAVAITGSYRAGNDRSDMEIGPCVTMSAAPSPPGPSDLITPTTPCFHGNRPTAVEPGWLRPLIDGHSKVTGLECHWRGRIVHRATHEDTEGAGIEWCHRNADDWDNLLDPAFLEFTENTALELGDDVYLRDRQDWANSNRSRRYGWPTT
ncbi:hypothetical protein GPX89_03325 [Nocardia sp. ET3-3]|uniref:Uncharacterized protein n=1 Tax=Nocardia terrae TaxID=2675851 RepID=A0A7K1UPL7_9NOCA|nr:hypothetical protein [Nocardia terrae]MVU76271.1 hypothetical protein [Nocardia terrae]